VGIFAGIDPLEDITSGRSGLLHGGDMYLLGVQTLACVIQGVWAFVVTGIILWVSNKDSRGTIGIPARWNASLFSSILLYPPWPSLI
jgi:hypothetical protein